MSRATRHKAHAAPPNRTAIVAAGVVAAVALAGAAFIFTNASTSRSLVDEAVVLHHSEALLGANDITVKALSQAVLLAEDLALGVADVTTVAAAVNEASAALDELTQAADALDAAVGREAPPGSVAAALARGGRVLDLLDRGDIIGAGSLLTGDARSSFIAVRDDIDRERDAAAASLDRTDDVVTRTANIVRYFVAFLIPVFAFATYRFIARRQLRVAEVELDARLEAEQEIGRAKNEFVANISHELRTPLTSIYGFSELLIEQGIIDPESTLDVIGLIHTESSELSRMVEDLLASARADAGSMAFQMAEVNVAEELRIVLEPLKRTGPDVRTDCPTDRVWADRLRVRQVLRNLVSNAQRHGGPHIRVEGRVAEGDLAIDVIDDGPGVPADLEPRLFTRFMHLGEGPLTMGSVGLGLAVVRILAEGMEGRVQYQRHDGETRFTVHLPLASPRRPPAAAGLSQPALVASFEPLGDTTVTWGREGG